MPMSFLKAFLALALAAAPMTQIHARAIGASGRQLLQASTPASASGESLVVAIVTTMEELKLAIQSGAAHIQVRSHIDATSFPLVEAEIKGTLYKHQLPPQRGRTHSIVGNCTEEPTANFRNRISGTPLAPLKQGQCLMLTQNPLFAFSESNVYFANFYVRYATATGGGFAFEEPSSTSLAWLVHIHGGNVWARDIRVEGDGSSLIGGLIVFPTAHGIFIDSVLTHTNTENKGAQVTIRNSPMTLLKCEFSHHVTSGDLPVIYADSGAAIWIQESNFTNNTAAVELSARGGAAFYSDDQSLLLSPREGAQPTAPPALSSAPADLKRLAWTEAWILELEPQLLQGSNTALPLADALEADGGIGEVEEPVYGSTLASDLDPNTGRAAGEAEPDLSTASASLGSNSTAGGGDGGDDSDSSGIIIGVVVALVVFCISAVATAYFCRRKKNAPEAAKQQQLADGFNVDKNRVPVPGPYGGPGLQYGAPYGAPSSHPYTPYGYQSRFHPPPPSTYASGPTEQTTGSSTADPKNSSVQKYQANFNPGMGGVVPFPEADATFTDDLTNYTLEGRTVTSATSAGSGPGRRGVRSNMASSVAQGSVSRGITGNPGSPVAPLPEKASLDDKLDRIHKQLDGMHAVGKPVMKRFELLGASHRRQGGQGIVQFARGVRDGLDYALKFFVSKPAFDAEGDTYKDTTLGPLLPKIEALSENDDGAESDAHGIALPPFIVMEKGEALDEWSRRAKPDLFQSVAMLANIAHRLADMHGAGFVHRDLKPGNVMWLPRENRWTIIDFGCVAKIGEECGIAYSLRYTAPEVIQTLENRERRMIPQPALDCWSLGVMAFELLTGQPAFQVMINGAQDIKEQLLGNKELPWEGERADPTFMRKLRSLRGPVMSLLDRDPARRPSMQKVCDMCDDIFGTRTVKAH